MKSHLLSYTRWLENSQFCHFVLLIIILRIEEVNRGIKTICLSTFSLRAFNCGFLSLKTLGPSVFLVHYAWKLNFQTRCGEYFVNYLQSLSVNTILVLAILGNN